MKDKEFEAEISRQMTGSLYDARGYMDHASYLATENGRAVSVRFDDPLQKHQGQIRSRLIRMIEERGLEPIGMLTVSPYRSLDHDQLDLVVEHIHQACRRRFDPRGRAGYSEPLLAVRENNAERSGMHLHLLFGRLNTGPKLLTKNVLTYGVQEAVESACKRLGLQADGSVPIDLLFMNEFHGYLYEYAIRNPIQYFKFGDSAYRGFRYIPNSCRGLHWSLLDEPGSDASSKGALVQKHFDGFCGWRGLVAYMTKGIFSNEDLSKYLCGETYARLNRLPVSPRSSLAELFE
tara:strand:+ start:501 stop:1373 length:873 start_codon:yes stop_codon:yes gene_type:complete